MRSDASPAASASGSSTAWARSASVEASARSALSGEGSGFER